MFDIHTSIHDRHGELNDRKAAAYRDGLLDAFANSPEGQALGVPVGGWVDLLFEYAFEHLGVAIPAMTTADFEEILFDLYPRKVSTPAESAGVIVTELRAFWQFVHRQYALPNAAALLAVLDGGAERRLYEALDNPQNYGMAKSFMMQGLSAGFDMRTPEGLAAFQAAYNARLGGLGGGGGLMDADDDLPPLETGPSVTPEKLRQEKDRKKQARKAQRQARKRNRKR